MTGKEKSASGIHPVVLVKMPTASAASASSTAAFSSSGNTWRPVLYQLPCPATGPKALADEPCRVPDPRLAEMGPLRVAGRAAKPSSSARLVLATIVLSNM